jgi:hypothetical protein
VLVFIDHIEVSFDGLKFLRSSVVGGHNLENIASLDLSHRKVRVLMVPRASFVSKSK